MTNSRNWLTLTARESTLDVKISSEVDPRTVRVNIFIMAVDPYHRYSNESERAKTFRVILN